jgi:hypothetical protein
MYILYYLVQNVFPAFEVKQISIFVIGFLLLSYNPLINNGVHIFGAHSCFF